MPQPPPARGRHDEPWERSLYVLLLLVAVAVILYSLFGIASLLGYLPLAQKGVGGAGPAVRPVLPARVPVERLKEGPLSENLGGVSCTRRTGITITSAAAWTGAVLDPAMPACAEAEVERRAARNPAVPHVSKVHASGAETTTLEQRSR
jgi:hypothetical protein